MSEFYKLLVLVISIPIFFVLVAMIAGWHTESFEKRVNMMTSVFIDALKLSFMLLTLGAILYRLNPLIWGLCLIVEWMLFQNDKAIVKGLNRIIVMKQNK